MKTKGHGGLLLSFISCVLICPSASPSPGSEGAAFLKIPVSGRPAALGSAYTALAEDAYAPTWNPGGLGFLACPQASGQHIAYMGSMNFEYLSFALPVRRAGFGGSIQYLDSGEVSAVDPRGNAHKFSSSFASYNLSYGRNIDGKVSFGVTGKLINAQIAGASAQAYALDFGVMYKAQKRLVLGASIMNLGTELKFMNSGDPLPFAVRLGSAWRPASRFLLSAESVHPRSGPASYHLGSEWRPLSFLCLRGGYKSDGARNALGKSFTAGIGIAVLGQEISYSWLPGDLSRVHYFSLLIKFAK